MNGTVLTVNGLDKRFDGVRALTEFSMELRRGEVLGIIGPNGAGKTTAFNVIGGFISPEKGRVVVGGKDITHAPPYRIARLGVSRTFQNLRLLRQLSVLDNVLACFQDQPGEKLRNVFFRWRGCRRREADNRKEAMALLEEVRLADKGESPAEALSYGQQKLLSLVCCLAAGADVLLLDEPVAGIAPEMTERILGLIRDLPSRGKSVILIEHDMDAVAQVCDRVIFMDAGRKVCEGTSDEVREDPRVIEAYLT
jgi:branched-chain amino acid transport system permease protein